MPPFATSPGAAEYAPFYAGYVAAVPDGDIIGILEDQAARLNALFSSLREERGDHRYAEGKWSIREVIGHVCDAERVMAYRALRIARADRTPMAGFDENEYIAPAEFGARSLRSLADEFLSVRLSTLSLMKGLPQSAWVREGVAAGHSVTVRALAYIIAGHAEHHTRILQERYGV